jgi:hypothetical protein
MLTVVALSWLLHLLFVSGFYFVGIVPAIAGLALGGAVYWTVSWSHCRNPWLIVVLSVTAGLALAVGHYYADMVAIIGLNRAHRVDAFPRYLNWRMKSDVIVDAGHGNPPGVGRQNDPAQVFFNWGFLAIDIGVISCLVTAIGYKRARKAYCEQHGCWLSAQTVLVEAGAGQQLVEILNAGVLAQFTGQLSPPVCHQNELCQLLVESCPAGDRAVLAAPVYLTITELGPLKKGGHRRRHRVLARQWELSDSEVSWLAAQFPSLRSAGAGTTAPQTRVQRSDAPALATIEAVPEPFGGQVLTRGHLWIGTILVMLPAIVAFGLCFGILGFALSQGEDLDSVVGFAALGGAFVMLAAALFWYLRYSDLPGSLYLYRLTRAAFAHRPELWVEPDDAEAEYIQVIPRDNWGKMMLENATDVGFLKVDRNRRQVLFEGDRERWRIPAAALVTCELESFVLGEGTQGAQTFFVAVLRAHAGSGLWEAPVTRRHIYFGKRGQAERERDAQALRDAIVTLLPERLEKS